jgi:hypothetical protein
MFNLWQIAAHALWIFGLAVLLAAWSFGYYEAQERGERVLALLSQPNYDLAVTIGIVFFFGGLAWADGRVWAKIILAVLALAAVGFLIYRRRQSSLLSDN